MLGLAVISFILFVAVFADMCSHPTARSSSSRLFQAAALLGRGQRPASSSAPTRWAATRSRA
ncbi:MAG: hypothetical protein U1E16_04600 [Hyphomicrobiales bacterium]